MPAFYQKHGGAVVSMAIDKYIYISINPKFDGNIRMSYSKTENVSEPSELKHELAKACLEMFDTRGVEITSVSDIPGEGSGLGSSSSFVVGLLKAIGEYCCEPTFNSPKVLAEAAYLIELGCGHNCGKQDHYAAAYGGLHFFKFLKDGCVEVDPICLEDDLNAFESQLMLFWTGRTRSSNEILKKQSITLSISKYAENTAIEMRNMAYELHAALDLGGIFTLGESLHRNWELKKSLSPGITEDWIDELYAKARGAGASGGKICGAGGGGFLLICAEQEHQKAIEKAVGLRRVPIGFAEEGSKVIYV